MNSGKVARWRTVALLGVLLAASAASGPVEAKNQHRQPHRWWQSAEVTQLLELTGKQSATLDRIYRRTLPKQRESMRRLNAEERILSQLVADMNVEEIDVTRQIDRVEAARSELSKTRILMVFRMHRVLTVSQLDILAEWMKRDSDSQDSAHTRTRRRP